MSNISTIATYLARVSGQLQPMLEKVQGCLLYTSFHLENSHVLPAMVRKLHLAKRLMEGDWDAVRKDLSLIHI